MYATDPFIKGDRTEDEDDIYVLYTKHIFRIYLLGFWLGAFKDSGSSPSQKQTPPRENGVLQDNFYLTSILKAPPVQGMALCFLVFSLTVGMYASDSLGVQLYI